MKNWKKWVIRHNKICTLIVSNKATIITVTFQIIFIVIQRFVFFIGKSSPPERIRNPPSSSRWWVQRRSDINNPRKCGGEILVFYPSKTRPFCARCHPHSSRNQILFIPPTCRYFFTFWEERAVRRRLWQSTILTNEPRCSVMIY